MKHIKKVGLILGMVGLLSLPNTAKASGMLGLEGGYGFGMTDGLDLTYNFGVTYDKKFGKNMTIGAFGSWQVAEDIEPLPGLVTSTVYVPYGVTLNFWMGDNFYIGGNVGMTMVRATISGITGTGSEVSFGGQAGFLLPLGKSLKLGVGGRYIYIMETTAIQLAQANGSLMFNF